MSVYTFLQIFVSGVMYFSPNHISWANFGLHEVLTLVLTSNSCPCLSSLQCLVQCISLLKTQP